MKMIFNRGTVFILRIFVIVLVLALYSCNFNRSDNRFSNSGEAPAENKVDPDRLAQMKFNFAIDYYDTLELLDKQDLNSIDAAVEMFKNSTSDSLSRESVHCDSMFVGLNDFLASAIQGYYENNLNNNEALKSKLRKGGDDSDISGFVDELNQHGINLALSEGECYLEADQEYLFENLKNHLSLASSEFLRMKMMDEKSSLVVEGLHTLSADSLAKKVIDWEDFIRRFPSYISINEAENLYSDYLSLFLGGTENSPVFNLESKKLDDGFKLAYESFIQNYPDRKSAGIIKQYYDLLSANEFKFSDKAGEFLMENVTQ
jgi:hypothetical protein